ncbi:hypothetical protein Tco_0206203 [Tanacetum coccineum]
MITTNNNIKDKKLSRLMLLPMGILETFPYVKDVDYITWDLAVSCVRFNQNLKKFYWLSSRCVVLEVSRRVKGASSPPQKLATTKYSTSSPYHLAILVIFLGHQGHDVSSPAPFSSLCSPRLHHLMPPILANLGDQVIEHHMAWSGLDLKMVELLASAAICKNGGVTDWYQRHGYREQGQNLNYNHISFSAIEVLRATAFQNKTMSSPNRSTSDIEDAFSSMNILNYTSVSPDYFPASSESSSFNSSENSKDNMIQPVFSPFYNNPCLKDVQAFYAKELPISSPDPITPPAILTPSPVLPPSLLFDPRYFFVPEELLPPKKRICSPSSSSTTLSNPSRNQTRNLVSPSSSVYTPTPPQIFEIGKCSTKMYLKHHEEQVEDILNYLETPLFTN